MNLQLHPDVFAVPAVPPIIISSKLWSQFAHPLCFFFEIIHDLLVCFVVTLLAKYVELIDD